MICTTAVDNTSTTVLMTFPTNVVDAVRLNGALSTQIVTTTSMIATNVITTTTSTITSITIRSISINIMVVTRTRLLRTTVEWMGWTRQSV
mmetsp:Transcript_9038/g.24420  ORF Transcript_9038/g.24420 Transcript_9038/m.24420 type:complete len:91 (-) Transcript_9038:147-419(-)